MLFQRINRSDAEKVFMAVQNISGGTLAVNTAVVWDTSSSGDGVRVTTPATDTLSCLVGIVNRAIVDSAYGLVQAYGYRASAVVNRDTTAIVAGDILIPIDASGNLALSGSADGKTGFITAGYAVASTNATLAANAPVFIRCL